MSEGNNELDSRLRELVSTARPNKELPPGFARQVWQRIEQGEATGQRWYGVASWILRPRIAWAALAALLLVAGSFGAARGVHAGEDLARERYLASVDPAHLGH